jgi:hypothetical protein
MMNMAFSIGLKLRHAALAGRAFPHFAQGGNMPKKLSLSFSAFLCLILAVGLARADFLTPAKNISNSPASDSLFPKVASIPGTDYVFAVWIEVVGPDDLLCFSRSIDGGSTWSTPFQLTYAGQIQNPSFGDPANVQGFSLAAANPYLHIVAQYRLNDTEDFEILYIRSPDLGENGLNWEFSTLTDNSTDSLFPDVAAGAGYVHVTYQDNWPGNVEVMYKRIADNGGGGVDKTRRLTFSDGYSIYPRIAVSKDGGTVHIVYSEQFLAGGAYLFYKRIADAGAGAYSTRRLTFGTDPANDAADHPDIAVSTGTDDQYVYIVYEALWPGNREIIYKRMDNYGNAGGSVYTARLTYSTTDTFAPAVSFDGVNNIVQIAYFDRWTGNDDVMHRKLLDYGGGGFAGQQVSWGYGGSIYPSVTAVSSGAYIAWADESPGNYEILVKKGS